jgi:hypothetical protein
VPRHAGDHRQQAVRDRSSRFRRQITRLGDAQRVRHWLERGSRSRGGEKPAARSRNAKRPLPAPLARRRYARRHRRRR